MTMPSVRKRLNLAIAYDPVKDARRVTTVDADISPDNMLDSQIDWVIRCGDVQRTSGFFPLNTMYAEWTFLPQMWPEMTHQLFLNTLDSFTQRERRFGG